MANNLRTVRGVLLLGVLWLFGNTAYSGDRFSDYQMYVHRYVREMGVEHTRYVFTTANDTKRCAWVALRVLPDGFYPDAILQIGLSIHPTCRHNSVKTLARHEVCHLRMQHLWIKMSNEEKEREVKQCMEWYKKRF